MTIKRTNWLRSSSLTATRRTAARAAQEALKTESDKLAQLYGAFWMHKRKKRLTPWKCSYSSWSSLTKQLKSHCQILKMQKKLWTSKSKLARLRQPPSGSTASQITAKVKVFNCSSSTKPRRHTTASLQTYAEQKQGRRYCYYQPRSLPYRRSAARASANWTSKSSTYDCFNYWNWNTGVNCWNWTAGSASPVKTINRQLLAGHVCSKTGENSFLASF